jgi:branched-chain amino acid transport system substrate-binding protein
MTDQITRRGVNAAIGAALVSPVLGMAPAFAASGAPIKIGFGMALTGPLSPNGKQAVLGAKIWEERTNKAGGLLGRPVKIIYYDDQSNPATEPGIYTKLLDVDKCDLVVGPYATAQAAPAMPVIIAKGKVFISLFALAVNSEFHYPRYFAMLPTGPDTKPAFTEGFFQLAAEQQPKPRTVAMAWADLEFSHNAAEGARINAKKHGFTFVYDRSYPPATTDFTPIVRAMQSSNADLALICSYPLDSVGMVRAVNEVGYTPKMLGGAMVGLQTTSIKEQLGPLMNGIVNYETWVPSPKLLTPPVQAFLSEYQSRAPAEGVDPLGYYLGTWGYAYLEVLADAIKGTGSLDDDKIARYLHSHKMPTIMGDIAYNADGEWVESRMLQVQYHDIKPGAGLDVWRGMSYQTVLTPPDLKTGNVIYPYAKAKINA